MDSQFTNKEKEMLLMLLNKEENTLEVEINHSVHREFKLILKDRLKLIHSMIEKIKIMDYQESHF